jgi:hypothetical protein
MLRPEPHTPSSDMHGDVLTLWCKMLWYLRIAEKGEAILGGTNIVLKKGENRVDSLQSPDPKMLHVARQGRE